MSETMTAPQNARERTDFARRWTVPTHPEAFLNEVKDLLGGPTEIERRFQDAGYSVDRKTVGRWLSGESSVGIFNIWRLLELMDAEHNRRDGRRRAFFGGG